MHVRKKENTPQLSSESQQAMVLCKRSNNNPMVLPYTQNNITTILHSFVTVCMQLGTILFSLSSRRLLWPQ